jgi:peptidoglycan L-alanyl-D-glutamate endopeptidase CwlK
MAGRSQGTPEESTGGDEAGQKPGKSFSNSALIALLSSLLAVVVPVTTAIVEHYEKEKELALKDKELEQNITLECLKLAVSKDTPPADKRRVLQAIVSFDTPLRQWALDGVSQIDKESEAAQKQAQSVQSSFDSRGTAPVGLVVLKNKEVLLQQRISRESQNGDAGAADADLETLLNVKSQEMAFVSVPVHPPVNGHESTAPPTGGSQATLADSGLRLIPTKEADVTVEIVQKMFPGAPAANIKANLPFVLNALKQFGIIDRTMLLVALSTIRAEQPEFMPFEERENRFNTSPGGQPFDLYDKRFGNNGEPDGARFKGRGYILITGRANYTKMSTDLGLGTALLNAPDKASDPKIAAQLLALYLQQRVVRIKQAASADPVDFAQMRKLVNGGTNGLNQFVDAYQTGDRLLPK